MGVGEGYPAIPRIEDFRVKIKISFFLSVGPLDKIASSPLSMIIRTHHFIAKNKKREVIHNFMLTHFIDKSGWLQTAIKRKD